MKMLECCFNWKVVAGVAAVGIGLLLWQPQQAITALPTLALAICPLSMGLMAFTMWRSGNKASCAMDEPAAQANAAESRMEALQARLLAVRAQQDTLACQLAELQKPSVVRDAEDVARAAEDRLELNTGVR